MPVNAHYFLILFLLITATACNENGPDVVTSQQVLQERLITAEAGDTIRIDSGTFQSNFIAEQIVLFIEVFMFKPDGSYFHVFHNSLVREKLHPKGFIVQNN